MDKECSGWNCYDSMGFKEYNEWVGKCLEQSRLEDEEKENILKELLTKVNFILDREEWCLEGTTENDEIVYLRKINENWVHRKTKKTWH